MSKPKAARQVESSQPVTLSLQSVELTTVDGEPVVKSGPDLFGRKGVEYTIAVVPKDGSPVLIDSGRPKVPLTKEDVQILEAIKERHPLTVSQYDLEATLSLSRKTIGKHAKYLMDQKLIDRPHGNRKGYSITDAGISSLKSVAR